MHGMFSVPHCRRYEGYRNCSVHQGFFKLRIMNITPEYYIEVRPPLQQPYYLKECINYAAKIPGHVSEKRVCSAWMAYSSSRKTSRYIFSYLGWAPSPAMSCNMDRVARLTELGN